MANTRRAQTHPHASLQLPQTMLSHDSVKLLSLLGADSGTPIRTGQPPAAAGGAAAPDAPEPLLRAPSVPVADTYCVDFVFEGANAHIALAQAHMSLVLPSVGAPSTAGSVKRSQASLNDLAAAQNQWTRSSDDSQRVRMRDDGEMLVTGPLAWTDHTVRLIAPAAASRPTTGTSAAARAPADSSSAGQPPLLSLASVTMLYHRRAPTPSPMHTVRLVPEWRSGLPAGQVRMLRNALLLLGKALIRGFFFFFFWGGGGGGVGATSDAPSERPD